MLFIPKWVVVGSGQMATFDADRLISDFDNAGMDHDTSDLITSGPEGRPLQWYRQRDGSGTLLDGEITKALT